MQRCLGLPTVLGHCRTIEAKVVAIQTEIDNCSFELYGIGEADRRAIVEGFGGGGD